MASSDQPNQTKPSGRRITRTIPAWAYICTLLATVAMAGVVTMPAQHPIVINLTVAGWIGFVASLLVTVVSSTRREAAAETSQEGLANAEQALEDALRQQRRVQVHELFADEVGRPPQVREGEAHGEPLGRPLDTPAHFPRPAPSDEEEAKAEEKWASNRASSRTSVTGHVYQAHGDMRIEAPLPRADLALPELWHVTHRRLGHYHGIATKQAERSFWNAQVASVTGFVLLVAFVVMALTASTTTGSIVAGGLGAVSAALSGFVSRTFVRSQEASASHLRSYFDQPLELSRFLAAERLIADANLSESQRAEVLTALVQAMAAGPAQLPQDNPIPPQRSA